MSDIVTRRVYFTMVAHPINGPTRVGNAFASEQAAKDWLPFVRGAWRGCRASVSTCTLRWVDGVMDAASVAILDKKYNLDGAGVVPS